MLVLSRRVGERIKIGDSIYVTIMSIDRGKIRIGIDAPKDVSVFRTELIGESRWGSNNAKGDSGGQDYRDFSAGIEGE